MAIDTRIVTVYMDASQDNYLTDPNWTNAANVFDGSESTYGEVSRTGTYNVYSAWGYGTSSTVDGRIVSARARMLASQPNGAGTAGGMFQYADIGTTILSISSTGNLTPTWTTWANCNIQNFYEYIRDLSAPGMLGLTVDVWGYTDDTIRVYKVELEITYVPIINNFWGAETGGLQELVALSGTVTAQQSIIKGGAWAYQINDDSSMEFHPFESVADAGGEHIIGAWIRLSAVTATSENLVLFNGLQSGSTYEHFWVELDTSGNILYRDADDVVQRTVSSPPITVDTLHLFELYWKPHDTTGFMELFIDGVSQGLTSNIDTINDTGTTFDRLRFGDGTGTGSGITMYVDDIYYMSGCTSSADRLGPVEVISYRSNLNSATPDSGNILNSGVWADCQEVPFSETNVAVYTGTAFNGYILTDDVGGSAGTGGPDTDANLTGSVVATKGVWRMKRGNGGSTSHLGRIGQQSNNVYVGFSLTTSYANRFTVNENSVSLILPGLLGFGNNGNQDTYCADMLYQILHVPAVASGKAFIYNPAQRYAPFLVR